MLLQFSPNLFAFTGSFFASEAVFVVKRSDESLLLIDTGLDPSAAHLFEGFSSLGKNSLSRLSLIAFTHRHPDHIGGLPALLSALGNRSLPLIAHQHDAERFNEYLPEAFQGTIAITQTVKHEEYIDSSLKLRAIHTPGHTLGHLCFLLEKEGILIVGDLFMRVFGLLYPVFKKYHDDYELWRQTLPTIMNYDWDYAIPTHRKPAKIPRKRVEQFIRRMGR